MNHNTKLYLYVKRGLDILIALCTIAVFLIPMIIIALAIYHEDKQSVIFRQNRIGKNGKLFTIYKFRTMTVSAPDNISSEEMAKEKCYVTKVGHFLRHTSLDELPQLFNIVKGDMSLIGPRPLIPSENEIHLMRMERNVYAVRPGISGLAQIYGRNQISDRQKVEYDSIYLETISLKKDLIILLKTIPCVVQGTGICDYCNTHNNGKVESDVCLTKRCS